MPPSFTQIGHSLAEAMRECSLSDHMLTAWKMRWRDSFLFDHSRFLTKIEQQYFVYSRIMCSSVFKMTIVKMYGTNKLFLNLNSRYFFHYLVCNESFFEWKLVSAKGGQRCRLILSRLYRITFFTKRLDKFYFRLDLEKFIVQNIVALGHY